MSIVSIEEQFQPSKYLIVSQQTDPETTITTRLIISDTRANQVNLLTIERGPQGDRGSQGPQGPPGQDGVVFNILSVASGGTNNTSFQSGHIIYYDGHKLASSSVALSNLNTDSTTSHITGVVASSGMLAQYSNNNTVVDLSVALGDGLKFDNNAVAIDDTIARVYQLSLGSIEGVLPINKGGTNNTFFSQNRLLYFDGLRFRSYPIETGRFLLNGSTSIQVIAGSGLRGGGPINVPNGSVVLNLPESADLIIEDNLLKLSNTGVAGTYSKVTTDNKGRVVSGSVLTQSDILGILGYTPWHPGNDGAGSTLDADLLDGRHGSFYQNAANITGTINTDVLPNTIPSPGLYTKVAINTKGLVEGTYYADQQDIISSLGYTPLSVSGGSILNNLSVGQNLSVGGEVELYDNLVLLGANNTNILPSAPRGITFRYGGLYNNKTGIIAYYPTENSLKLVTNIFSTPPEVNGGDSPTNPEDINGGDADSIFVVDSIEGTQATVLLRHIADTLYVSAQTEQLVNGLKTFLNGIAVQDQIVIYDKPNPTQPPLVVGSNNLLVSNFNADFLDDRHGSYYRNAANMTGSFSYNNVKFDHIQGTHNFIPRFSDTVNTPAGRIANSQLYQDNSQNLRLTEDTNLSVGGDTNTIRTSIAKNAVAIGTDNIVAGENVLAVGEGNIASGNNSVAMNYRSQTANGAANSLAMGAYGNAWLNNQFAIGAYRSFDNNNVSIEHAQQSTVTMHLAGTTAHNSWQSLQPIIPIPKNKSIAYNLELLISKAFGTNLAHFYFESGLVKNASFRDMTNPINIINITTHPQQAQKTSGFNNSQIKTHFHTYEFGSDTRIQQNIDVTESPLKLQSDMTQNIDPYYYYKSQNLAKTGTYHKLNDGTLILDIDKPIFSGVFEQNATSPAIRVFSVNHQMTPNSFASIEFLADGISGIPLSTTPRKVISSISSNEFYVDSIQLSGYLSYHPYNDTADIARIIIDQDSVSRVDSPFHFFASGNLNSNILSNIDNATLLKFVRPGMNLKIVANNIVHNRYISAISNSNITINNTIATTQNNNIINHQGPVFIYSLEYSYYLLKTSKAFYINNDTGYGQFFADPIAKVSGTNFQNYTFGIIDANIAPPTGYTLPFAQNSGVYEVLDFDHKPSIAIDTLVPKRIFYTSGLPVTLTPLIANTGKALIYQKTNYSGSYQFGKTEFHRYDGIYQRFNDGNQAQIKLFNQKLEPINIPFAPIKYSLTTGYGDFDNDKFYITSINDQYYLHTKNRLNYEEQDIYSIRIKAEDRSTQNTLEKQLHLFLDDSLRPYLNITGLNIQSATVLEPFVYALPENVFGVEENGGPLSFSATIKNWHSLPDWLSFDTNLLTFSGLPSGCDLGPQTIRVVATNSSGYTNYIDWRLNVVDPSVQTLSYFNNQSFQSNNPNIRNISLSRTRIEENPQPSSLIASLSCEGSYHPYLLFHSAYNNFSGIFRNGSPLIECQQVRLTGYPTITLTGTPALLATGSLITSSFSNLAHIGSLPANTRVTHIYKPLVFSGTPLISGDKIIFNEFDYNYNHSLYTGAKILADAVYFDPTTTIKTWNDYSLDINSVVLQEDEYLLWTENDDVLLHQDSRQTVNGIDAENKFDLYTENNQKIIREDTLAINTIWASGYEGCKHGDLLKGHLFFYNSNEAAPLRNISAPIFSSSAIFKLNPPPPHTLKITSMVSGHTPIIFQTPINNTVMAVYNAGLDEWGELLTEDDHKIHSEEILNDSLVSDFCLDDDCELLAEDNHILKTETYYDYLISDSFFDHGSRIELSDNYEIIDGYNVYKNNGKLGTQEEWSFLLTEDDQPLVHDYAVVSKAGSAFVVFPGRDKRNINWYYPAQDLSNDVFDYAKNIYYTIGSLIPFGFATDKYVLRVDKPYIGQSASGLVMYSGGLPIANNYAPSGLEFYDYFVNLCGELSDNVGIKGFSVSETGYFRNTQYVTGLVSFYTEPGTGTIDLTFQKQHNLDTREENFLYLKQFTKTSQTPGPVPKIGLYDRHTISSATNNQLSIYNRFLFPNSGQATTGTFTANIDRNHGYTTKSSVFLNHTPVRFDSVNRSLNNQIVYDTSLRPKNNIFNILAITGNKVLVDDSQNYLLKEFGRPDYFAHSISGSYITNGLSFQGSAFRNTTNLYDIRYDRNILERALPLCTFEYYHDQSVLNINIPSGFVRPFDDLVVSFPTGHGYDTNNIYRLIHTDMVKFRSELLADLEPNKDELLLESSPSYVQSAYAQKLVFNNTILNNVNRNINGTCNLDLKIEHRLQPGYTVNYNNSSVLGHKILNVQSGFTFSGFVPRYNNIISSDNLTPQLLPEHIGYASIFNTGSSGLLDGGRLLRQALSDDIGFVEYYYVGSSGITPVLTGVSGIGTASNPYYIPTSGLANTRSYDFLYLGHNDNQIRFYGSGNFMGYKHFVLEKYTLSDQLQIMRLANRNIISGVVPLGTLSNYSGNFNFVSTAKRFDYFRILVSGHSNNVMKLNTCALHNVPIKPWILDSNTVLHSGTKEPFFPYLNQSEPETKYVPNTNYDPNTLSPPYIPIIDPSYSIFNTNQYYILPFLRTSTKYCDQLMAKNIPLFFNGNTIVINNLNTFKTYSQASDEFVITSLNTQAIHSSGRTGRYITKIDSTSNAYALTGIITDGSQSLPPRSGLYRFDEIYENQYRFDSVFGLAYNQYLPYTGTISFTKSTSGTISVFDYNNIYYHTYGGQTANWPMDTSGKQVPHPQTGVYLITDNPAACESGTLCVLVSGFNGHIFTNINEINIRSSFGEYANIVSTNNVTGYVRPYGANQKFYFDFTDESPALNGIYYIKDMISPNLMALNIPYRPNLAGRRGIVYLIDSHQNIKSNLNPNINNQFIVSQGTISNPSLLDNQIFNYFDHNTKRWKHAANLKQNIPYTGHIIALNNTPTTILSINSQPIRISGISYRFDATEDSDPFYPLVDGQLIIPSNKTSLTLKITTLDGEQQLVPQYKPGIPKVDISGLYNYMIETNQPSRYNYHGSGWNVGVNITLPNYNYNAFPVNIKVKDLTGSAETTLNIQRQIIPTIAPIAPSYAIKDGVWHLGFDVKGFNDLYTLWQEGDITLNLHNVPTTDYRIKYLNASSVMFSGSAGSLTGTYNPILTVTDFTTYQILSSGTGLLRILNNNAERPPVNIGVNNLSNTYYFDISRATDLLTFNIPAELGPEPSQVLSSLDINFGTDGSYRLFIMSTAYDYDLRRFNIMAKPIRTGDLNYINITNRSIGQTVNISLKQPVYDTVGYYTYNTYNRSLAFNTILYRPMSIAKGVPDSSLVFALDQPWFVHIDVSDGITAHDPTTRPKLKIYNSPNFGSYANHPLEYNLDWNYDTTAHKWSATASAKEDFFGKYVHDTGVYPLHISVHDNLSGFASLDTSIIYTQKQALKNIQNTVYATVNNEFFSVVDLTDLDDNNTQSPNIIGVLKEPSVQINNSLTQTKHDTDLNLWQYGIVGQKFINKYDARIIVDNNNITVQCQGLGNDKIIAAARLNMVEIESTQMMGLPLTITGIVGYNPVSGTVVSQGEEGWSLKFKTIGGLADYRYPPTIVLENMPTFCNGFNPLIETQQQCVIAPPKWTANDMGGSWSYIFSGLPSCTLLGRKNFTITAIDTNTSLLPASPYLPDTDTVNYFFMYQELPPISYLSPVIEDDPNFNNQTIISPLCNLKYQKKLIFGPAPPPSRACATASMTGIKTINISGSLPSGLSYSVFFPGVGDNPNPEPPYSNLGSGHLIIQGYPLTFAGGGSYNEKLGLIVTDARNNVTTRIITFEDSSTPNNPNISATLYFDSHRPVLSPKTGLAPLRGGPTMAYRPAPAPYDLVCHSILPHNTCPVENAIYSGTLTTDTRIRIRSQKAGSTLAFGNKIYIEFNNNPSYALNNTYTIFNDSVLGLYIDPGISVSPPTGYAKLVKGVLQTVNLSNFYNLFDGVLDDSTKYCLLGGGSLMVDTTDPENADKLGIGGLLVPTATGALTGMNIFSTTDIHLTGLSLQDLDSDLNNNYFTSRWTNCWETGYLRISGIILPPINAEIADPPPAQNLASFSFNGQVYALATKLSFGDNEAQKLLIENQRVARPLSYRITDVFTSSVLTQGSVSSFSSFDTPVLNVVSGTVYKLDIVHSGNIFPTYNMNALPFARSTYYWTHKGGNLVSEAVQSSFPPLYPTLSISAISVLNDLANEDPNGSVMIPVTGSVFGGYITPIGSSWSSRTYIPKISGIIQKSTHYDLSGNYTYNNQLYMLSIPSGSIQTGYHITIELYQQTNTPFDTRHLVVNSDILTNTTTLQIPRNAGQPITNGTYIVRRKTVILDYRPSDNTLILAHPNLPVTTGDRVSIDQDPATSTDLYLLDKNGDLSVQYKDHTLLEITNSNKTDSAWTGIFNTTQPVKIMKNFDDNIKIMPYNINGITEGRYGFLITGRANAIQGDYLYKICTMENSAMPIFQNNNLTPKKYFQSYPLYVNKPIKIVKNSITKMGMGSNWNISFRVDGGLRPVYENTPDIQISIDGINFGYCGFRRLSTQSLLRDVYDQQYDQLLVQLFGSPGVDWSNVAQILIRVADGTGVDIVEVSMV